MPVPTLVTDLSTTLASNSPSGSDNVFPDLDNYLRAMSGFIASIRDNSGNGWVSPYLPLTYSAGTANGVMYLNGSKVVTTGSALTFDGTNLGIGTSSPGEKLAINQGNIYAIRTGGAKVRLADENNEVSVESLPTGSASNMVFKTSTATQMTLDASGNLLVGTTSNTPAARINVAASGVGLNVEAVTVSGAFKSTTSGTETGQYWNAATAGNNIFVAFYTETVAAGRGTISYNRGAGLVAYNTTSDYRAKHILGPVANSGATIDALKVYEGRMKGATQSRPMLVAHEAQAVAPYSVTGEKDAVNEDGTPKFQQMDVSSLVPLLLAEIQSLRARVAALEAA